MCIRSNGECDCEGCAGPILGVGILGVVGLAVVITLGSRPGNATPTPPSNVTSAPVGDFNATAGGNHSATGANTGLGRKEIASIVSMGAFCGLAAVALGKVALTRYRNGGLAGIFSSRDDAASLGSDNSCAAVAGMV